MTAQPHHVSLGYWSPALLVECPICRRDKGAICVDCRGNGRWGRPHKTRLNTALALPPGKGSRRNDKADPLVVYRARQAAGWKTNALGWVAPCGTTEDDWALEGWPFPEEPGFAEWFSVAYHYDYLDDAPYDAPPLSEADAYPFAPADANTIP